MLAAINDGDPFTEAQYNLLRVVAAFPLAANFNSPSKVVRDALQEDAHPLAKLSNGALTAELATCEDGKSLVNQLEWTFTKARVELGEDSDAKPENEPKPKRRKGVVGRTDVAV
jgi:hypothetical protein